MKILLQLSSQKVASWECWNYDLLTAEKTVLSLFFQWGSFKWGWSVRFDPQMWPKVAAFHLITVKDGKRTAYTIHSPVHIESHAI